MNRNRHENCLVFVTVNYRFVEQTKVKWTQTLALVCGSASGSAAAVPQTEASRSGDVGGISARDERVVCAANRALVTAPRRDEQRYATDKICLVIMRIVGLRSVR